MSEWRIQEETGRETLLVPPDKRRLFEFPDRATTALYIRVDRSPDTVSVIAYRGTGREARVIAAGGVERKQFRNDNSGRRIYRLNGHAARAWIAADEALIGDVVP